MKKLIFSLTIMSMSIIVCAQQYSYMNTIGIKFDANATSTAPSNSSTKNRGVGDAFPSTIGSKHVIGKTTYDLQTNSCLQDRIMVVGNEVHAGWTMSQEANVTANSAYADRGTAYNYFNGTAWGAAPSARLEGSIRTGFGGMAINGNGNVVYMAHDFGSREMILSEKTSSGWTVNTTALSTTGGVWPDMATADNWMYVITGSDDSNSHTNGIRGGYFFSRSDDNGATWLDNQIPMPLVDSSGHYWGEANSYSIAARDSIVAIVFGRLGSDVTLVQSNDYGVTWTKKTIWDWPLEFFDFGGLVMTDTNNDATPDTLWTNAGSIDLAIDKAGEVHVAFPVLRVYKDGTTTGYTFFYRTLLSYYNSIADSVRFVDDIFAWHHVLCGGDSTIDPINNYTASPGGAIYSFTPGLISMPQVSVNESNNDVYLTYTATMEGDQTEIDILHPYWLGISGVDGQPYRDVMVLASNDMGATFGYPVNISRTRHYEEAFPSVPERISGTDLHVLYQGDIEPGLIMQADDIYDADFENWMIYQKVAIADIFTEGVNSSAPCGQFELPLSTSDISNTLNGTIKVYPNPAVDYITVVLELDQRAKQVTYGLYDLMGRLISEVSYNNVTSNNVDINIQGLAAGNYLLKVRADNTLSSHKVSVQ